MDKLLDPKNDFAFKKIFGKIPFDYRRLMKTISQIHLDLKQYLVHLELADDDFLNNFLKLVQRTETNVEFVALRPEG